MKKTFFPENKNFPYILNLINISSNTIIKWSNNSLLTVNTGLEDTLDQNISDLPKGNVHSLSRLHFVQLFN